jgi:hypothetical protein
MTKRALVLGCSHAAGAEMHKDTSIKIDHPDSFGYLNSYPVLIAKKLGYVPLNYAISGGSNDAMFRIFCEHMDQFTYDDIIIACWTGIDRTEIWHELDQRWLPLCIGQHNFYPIEPRDYALSGQNVGGKISCYKDYELYNQQWSKYQVDLKSSQLNKLKNITALNELAKDRSIPVMNLDSFWPVKNNVQWVINETFWDWAARNNCVKTAGGHYFLDTHQRFADLIVANYKP